MKCKLSIIAERLDEIAMELDDLGHEFNSSLLNDYVNELYRATELLETIAGVIE